MVTLKLLCIAFLTTFVIDLSGFLDELKELIAKLLNVKSSAVNIPKPFSCSLCLTWWLCLIYLWYAGVLTLFTIALAALIANLTIYVKDFVLLIGDCLSFILRNLFSKLK